MLIRGLMFISQALLLLFLSYWLVNEYDNEKGQLKKELLAELEQAQKQVTDSIITVKFVDPILKEGASDLEEVLKKNKILLDSSVQSAIGSHKSVTYNLDQIPKGLEELKDIVEKSGKKSTHIKLRRSWSADGEIVSSTPQVYYSENKDTIINIQTADSENASKMLSGVFKIIASELIKDSLNNLKAAQLGNDSALTKTRFEYIINSKGLGFKTEWTDRDTSGKKIKEITLDLDNNQQIEVSGYNGYLFKEILPQILFGLLLLIVTGTAFWFTYRSLRRQIKLSELKNGLISNMSHELKTPVSTVKVALEALDNFDVVNHPEKAREYVQMAMLETHRLELLVNKALNTSLMEQGKMTLQRQEVNLYDLVADIVSALRLRLEQKGAVVNLTKKGERFITHADKLHVQGAVMNIIDNSIKYGTPPTVIDITITATDSAITIEIADNGPGIPQEYSGQVFDKFFRVPDGDTHNVKGYGLGLSYVQQVMQLHEGSVQMNNKPQGGCSFKLKFFRGR